MTESPTTIHPATHIGRLSLTVNDLESQIGFYERTIGFSLLERTDERAILGVEPDGPLLTLVSSKSAPRRPRRTTGLYHFAILVPTRAALGEALARLPRSGYSLGGYADHLVSEALYLSDPEGNGIEIYRDRPRSEWSWENGTVRMASDHIDLEQLLREGQRDGTSPDKMIAGTTIGHMHLQVPSIPEAERFYHGVLGFDIVAAWPGALFVSAGGYHHHLGLNTWETNGAPRPPAGSTGLRTFDIVIPDEQGLAATRAALADAGIPTTDVPDGVRFEDPFGNTILLSRTGLS
jgi:catechol 2,3-dioxygenase